MSIDTSQIKKNVKLLIDNQPYVVVDFQHVSPGKGAAFTRTKIKNLITQNLIERNFRSGDKLDQPDIEERQMQFMYQDSDGFHLMDQKNYEQLFITAEQAGDRKFYFQEGVNVAVLFFNGRPITVDVPNFVILTITKTDPGFRGDTVTGGTKPAVLETGLSISIPLHLNEGDKIKVDSRDGSYVEKAN